MAVLVKVKSRPAYAKFATLLLFITCIGFLAGRFTLDRLSPSLPSIDLRWGFVIALVLLAGLWLSVPNPYFATRLPMRGAGWFTAWITWMAASAIWSPHSARITRNLEDIALLGFFVLFAWWILSHLPADDLARVFKWLLIVGVIYFALSVAQGPQAQGRFSAPGGGPNVFARIMVLATFAALFYLVSRRKMLLVSLLIPLFFIGAVLSGSRGALLGAGVAVFLAIIPLLRRLGFWKSVFRSMVIVTAGAFALSMAKIDVIGFIEERYISQTFEMGYSSGRDEITVDVWRLFLEHPIFGTGLDGYYALQIAPGFFEYPHNLLLATLAEGGLIGAFLLVGCWLSLFRSATRHRPMSPVAFVALMAFLFLTVASFTSGDYYDSRYLWFFGVLSALASQRFIAEGDVEALQEMKAPPHSKTRRTQKQRTKALR